MKSEKLFAAIGELDAKFVEEAASVPKLGSNKRVIIGLGALAACIALAASAAYLYDRNEPEVLHRGPFDGEQYVSSVNDPEPCVELSLENAYGYEALGRFLPKKWLDGSALSECFPEATALVFERRQDIPGSRTVMHLILDGRAGQPSITLVISDEDYFEEAVSADGFEYGRVYSRGSSSRVYVKSGGYVAEYFTESGDLSELGGLFDMICSAECFAETPENGQLVSLNDVKSLDVAGAFISLSGEDYAAMTYGELTEYFGIAPPADEVLPYLSRVDGDYGIYRTDGRGVYYDGNSVCFESEDGVRRLKVGLAKVFKQGGGLFELVSDELAFTDINGREIAIFRFTGEDGQTRLHAEFLAGSVAVYADAENIPCEDFVSCLKQLVGESEQSAGSEHTVAGTVSAADSYANKISIAVDGEEKLSCVICLPDGISAEDYGIGDAVTVTFKGEPATVLTVWKEQLISVEPKK